MTALINQLTRIQKEENLLKSKLKVINTDIAILITGLTGITTTAIYFINILINL